MMTLSETIEFIKMKIKEALKQNGIRASVNSKMSLIGSDSALDSMMLVGLCLTLEDKAGDEFEFDWTSETAMSKSRSMFRSVHSLAEEFIKQQRAQQ